MPNWCKGELKVRGTKENLKRFVLKGLLTTEGSESRFEANEYKISRSIICEKEDYDSFYLAGTKRQYIESKEIYVEWPDEESEWGILVLPEFEAAWIVDTKGLAKLSKKFDVDFKIYAFEMGQEFNQDVEIVEGKIIKDNIIEFDDYLWECACPSIGG